MVLSLSGQSLRHWGHLALGVAWVEVIEIPVASIFPIGHLPVPV